jgi:hypothetical protein
MFWGGRCKLVERAGWMDSLSGLDLDLLGCCSITTEYLLVEEVESMGFRSLRRWML